MQVTCGDLECKYNDNHQCNADAVDHTADRFCATGRRKPRDETAELMRSFKSNCVRTQSGYKAKHGNVLK